jgi:hypothetical protein
MYKCIYFENNLKNQIYLVKQLKEPNIYLVKQLKEPKWFKYYNELPLCRIEINIHLL